MKTTFEDFAQTTLYLDLVKTYEGDTEDAELFRTALKTAFLVGHQLGCDKAKPGDDGKNPAAVSLGRLGGVKGGKARAAKLSPARRSAISKKAAKTRWLRERQKGGTS